MYILYMAGINPEYFHKCSKHQNPLDEDVFTNQPRNIRIHNFQLPDRRRRNRRPHRRNPTDGKPQHNRHYHFSRPRSHLQPKSADSRTRSLHMGRPSLRLELQDRALNPRRRKESSVIRVVNNLAAPALSISLTRRMQRQDIDDWGTLGNSGWSWRKLVFLFLEIGNIQRATSQLLGEIGYHFHRSGGAC